jgi:uncharacterized RDD family membrane protein YckC
MRCPKCQYISFDSVDRCRNCGYEFSLAVEDPPLDVTIGRDEPGPGRLGHASLTALDAPLAPARAVADLERDVEDEAVGRRLPTAEDLPLFTDRVADDQAPLVTPPAVPRPPLAVRRTNPSLRPRTRSPLPEELSLDLASRPEERDSDTPTREEGGTSGGAAGIVRRGAAGLIDLAVLGAIQATVVDLTFRLCQLTWDQWRLVPLVPLVAFLLLLSGGYFVLFTAAGGQTIGKMVARIRVVAASPEGGFRPVSFGAAVVRAVASLGSVLAVGTGFLPVLFGADRRAFHDRAAGTRVVIA